MSTVGRVLGFRLGVALFCWASCVRPCPAAASKPAGAQARTPYRMIPGIPKGIEEIQAALARVEKAYEAAAQPGGKKGKSTRRRKTDGSVEARAVAAAELHRYYKEALYYLRAKKYDKHQALRDRLRERSAALKQEFERAGAEGVLVLYLPNVDRWVIWNALPEAGTVTHVERIGGKPFDDMKKILLPWLNTGRWAPKRHSSMKGIPSWAYKADDRGLYQLNDAVGKEMIFWFYLRSPKKQQAKLKVSLAKGDTVDGIYVNLAKQKSGRKKSVSLKLRQGINHVLVCAVNKKNPVFEIGFQVTGAKELQVAHVVE